MILQYIIFAQLKDEENIIKQFDHYQDANQCWHDIFKKYTWKKDLVTGYFKVIVNGLIVDVIARF